MNWAGTTALVTGAGGSLGKLLCARLEQLGARVIATDTRNMDVRFADEVESTVRATGPDVIFHLAGAKHAPEGELDPWAITETNVRGTRNVLAAADGARVVLASTCKACDPETVYGATKLIAERMVLNAGGSVARFYNVRETCGNVFELWRGLDAGEPLPVTGCTRFFMGAEQAVRLLLAAAELEPGRYMFAAPERARMSVAAAELYPGREQVMVAPRRGDRLVEPRFAASESVVPVLSGVVRVTSPHDPVREPVAA